MKKLLMIFLTGQMLVISFIYGQSIYDIYLLNHMGEDGLTSYYLEEASGSNLMSLYDALMGAGASVEIIKEPITYDNILEYDVYDTENISVRHKVPVSKDKRILYKKLNKDEFVDSTGKFKSDIGESQIRKINDTLDINIRKYKQDNVKYSQVLKNNAINFIILILLSQFVLFVFTFSRIKINAIKKLNGFSPFRMIIDSFGEFIRMEAISAAIVIFIHVIYLCVNKSVSISYIIGLIITVLLSVLLTFLQLLLTQFSIRLIDVSSMMKNKMYSNLWCTAMNVIKVVFIVAITVSISLLKTEYNSYRSVLDKVEEYRSLNRFYTSNGYNSDEFDAIFTDNGAIDDVSKNMKNFYIDNYSRSMLVDANITSYATENYFEIYNTEFDQLLDSYSDNYVVINRNYMEKYLDLTDENGEKIICSGDVPTVLIPEKYRGNEDVKDFCRDQLKTFTNYDNIYKRMPEEETDDINFIYVKNDQNISIPDSFLLKNDEVITNSIVFVDNGHFDGTWYLQELSNGKLSFELRDRNEYKTLLEKYGLDKLLSAGTLLTPLSEQIRHYEFLILQSGIFAVLFSLTLLMIIYFSNYLEVIVNRKKYALKYLSGYSLLRSLEEPIATEFIIVIFGIILSAVGIFVIPLYLSVMVSMIIMFIMQRNMIIRKVSDIMRGE
jgi:putative ABC transport system permease protein